MGLRTVRRNDVSWREGAHKIRAAVLSANSHSRTDSLWRKARRIHLLPAGEKRPNKIARAEIENAISGDQNVIIVFIAANRSPTSE